MLAIVNLPPRGIGRAKGKTMTTTEFQVTGMTCGHCELSIREEVQEVVGVESVEVSHRTGKLVVTGDGTVDDAAVVAAVQVAGYQGVRSA
jgi:copper chaperone